MQMDKVAANGNKFTDMNLPVATPEFTVDETIVGDDHSDDSRLYVIEPADSTAICFKIIVRPVEARKL